MTPEAVAMMRSDRISESTRLVSPLDRLRRRSRSVQVRVFEDGFQVDVFALSNPRILRSELRTIYRLLKKGHVLVELTGVEEEWLPLGLDKVRHETSLKNSADALFFLAA
jgi:hypothetical protein